MDNIEDLSSGVHPFEEVRRSMISQGQVIDGSSIKQSDLYLFLTKNEINNFWDAESTSDDIEMLKSICDITWLFASYALSRGWDVKEAYEEAIRIRNTTHRQGI